MALLEFCSDSDLTNAVYEDECDGFFITCKVSRDEKFKFEVFEDNQISDILGFVYNSGRAGDDCVAFETKDSFVLFIGITLTDLRKIYLNP